MNFFIYALFITTLGGYAQSLKRQTISATGSSSNIGKTTIGQTIGQPYQTNSNNSNNIILRPGFQQSLFNAHIISTTIEAKVFPNPTEIKFALEISKELTDVTLTISDATGKLILNQDYHTFKKEEINCIYWANGTYLVSIKDKTGNAISTKVIKYL